MFNMQISQQHNHEVFMRKCIDLALIAKQSGDSAVGAILVRNKEIIAEGVEGVKLHKDITHHAEIAAIRQATVTLQTQDFSDCIMYTTHEPCIMCSYVIRHSSIKTIVIRCHNW